MTGIYQGKSYVSPTELNATTDGLNGVCVCVADEVPGSAVLVFDIELVEMEEGLPEGYMFIWNEDVSPDLFAEMDIDNDEQVEPSEVCQLCCCKII